MPPVLPAGLVLLLALAASLSPAAAQPTASFERLDGITPRLNGLSADGRVVVGNCRDSMPGLRACRWEGGTTTPLGALSTADPQSTAWGVSPDGSVAVGEARTDGGRDQAFRWSGGSMTGLPFFRPSAFPNGSTRALAVSAGGVVVGALGVTRALRWVGGGTPDSISTGYAGHITPDGATIVGQARDSGTDQRTFRWRAGERTLIAFPGHGFSFPTDVSDNGNVVVGQSRARLGANVAFRWRNGPGGGTIEEVAGPPGATFVLPLAVSGDGNTVAGRFGTDSRPGSFVFVWQGGTARSLESLLAAEYGVDTTGVRIADLYGLSADARTLVVFADLAEGQGSEFYRLRLGVPPVSERRWVDAAGGAFDAADNWDPQGAPGASETARFDLDAAYTVTGPAARAGGDGPLLGVGRLVIDAGTVDFSGVRFSVPDESPEAPALSVRFGGTARVVADTAFAALVSVGQEPLPAGDPRVARLQVFNAGTRLGAGSVAVGDAGPGELFVGVGGRLEAQTGYVGLSAPGEAVVGGEGSAWRVPELEVGGGGRGVLRVEAGGAVETEDATVGAAAPGDPSLVEVTGATPGGVPSTFSVGALGGGTLALGFEGGGSVEVRSGGLFAAGTAGVDVGTGGPGAGVLDVSGASPGGVRSRAFAGTLRVAVAAPGEADPRDGSVGVTGGAFLVADTLDVGAADGGTAFLLVSGTDPGGNPSALSVGTIAEPGPISVGERGRGEVIVAGGAALSGGDVRLGSVSTVQVLGVGAGGDPSSLSTRSIRVGSGSASEETDRAELAVGDGGTVLTSELGVGVSGGPGLSRVVVSGRGPTEPSILESFDVLGDDTQGRCVFGVISRAEAVVEGGGRLVCARAEIGGPSAAADVLVADSTSALVVARTLVVGSAAGERGVLRLDGFGVADATAGTALDVFDVVVRATGRILGQGRVVAFNTLVEAGGVLAPGVFVDGDVVEQERTRGGRFGGTLAVSGRLDLEPGSVLVVPVASADASRQGRLRVGGRARLGGTLRLAFVDGHAPMTGDVLATVEADTLGSGFAAVEVTGLAPGWTYAVEARDGQVVVTSLSDGVPTSPVDAAPAPGAPALALGVAPNPFRGAAEVRFALPAAARVRLAVVDVLGREVAVLADGPRAAGAHTARLDAARLAPGVYTLRLEADGAPPVAVRATRLR